jgi:hypothetical protein
MAQEQLNEENQKSLEHIIHTNTAPAVLASMSQIYFTLAVKIAPSDANLAKLVAHLALDLDTMSIKFPF